MISLMQSRRPPPADRKLGRETEPKINPPPDLHMTRFAPSKLIYRMRDPPIRRATLPPVRTTITRYVVGLQVGYPAWRLAPGGGYWGEKHPLYQLRTNYQNRA